MRGATGRLRQFVFNRTSGIVVACGLVLATVTGAAALAEPDRAASAASAVVGSRPESARDDVSRADSYTRTPPALLASEPSATPIPAPALPAPPPTPVPAPPTAVPVSTLAQSGIPSVALLAYQRAAASLRKSTPRCALPWSLVAAIGRVESNHGRFGGAQVYANGQTAPAILGPVLDGTSTENITDTDGGLLDGDTIHDRAVGPMQFIPSTWKVWGTDGNGDGKADPSNIFDAALSAGRYLCAAGGDLSTVDGKSKAVFAYNHVPEYVATVLALEVSYATGNPVVVPVPVNLPTAPPVLPPVNPGTPTALVAPAPAPQPTAPPAPSQTPAPTVAPADPAPTKAPSAPPASPTPTAPTPTVTPSPTPTPTPTATPPTGP